LHGKVAGDSRVRAAVRTLRDDGHVVEVRVTWKPGDAARLTTEAVADARAGKVGCIVAGGGDGSVNEVFAAAYAAGLPTACSLGVLPLGTANDFAHSAGVPVEDLTAALQLAVNAAPRPIDVGLVNDRPVINVVTGGFGSRVTVETDPELKRRLGGLAYAITGISRFAELSANHGRFRAEGFSWEGPFLALAIGNGRQAGGGIPLASAPYQVRLNFFSSNAKPMNIQPKKTANQATVQITAGAPVLGQAISTAPKAIESKPLKISHHSFSMTFRSWIAA
jgi:lipid kinase YegS